MRALVDTGIPHATWDTLGDGDDGRRGACATHRAVLAIPYLDVEGIRGAAVQGRARLRARRRRDDHAGAARAAGLRGVGDQHRARRPFSARSRSRSPRISASWKRLVRESGRRHRLRGGSRRRSAGAGVATRAGRSARTTRWRWRRSVVLRHRRGPLVTNLSTSRIVEDVAREAGVDGDARARGRGERGGSDARDGGGRSAARGMAG